MNLFTGDLSSLNQSKSFTLEEKISLIKGNQNGNGLSTRQLANKYQISKSSAINILLRSEESSADYASNSNKDVKRKFKDNDGQLINKAIFEWTRKSSTSR